MSTHTPPSVAPGDPLSTEAVVAQGRLRGNLGTGQLIITTLAYNAPIGITAGMLPLVIGFGGGAQAPLIYLGLGLLMLLFAVGYTYMARVIPRAGAFYTFSTEGLGRPAGLGTAFLAILGYVNGLLYILIYGGLNTGWLTLSLFGFELPWWIVTIVFAALVGVLGYMRIDVSAKVVTILVGIEVLAVVAYDVGVFLTGGAEQRISAESFDPTQLTVAGVATGAVFAIVAFGGFETSAIFRDEARDPKRSIPRAAYASVVILTVFYAIGSWLMVQGIGASQAQAVAATSPTTTYFDNITLLFGTVTRDVFTVLVITSGFACVLVMHNVSSRYLFNLAADGILPRALSRPHPRFGSPSRTSLLLTVLTLAFFVVITVVGVNPTELYVQMSGMAGLALISLLTVAAVAIAAYLWRTSATHGTGAARRIAATVAAIALIALLITAASTIQTSTGSLGTAVAAIGLPTFALVSGIVIALLLRKLRPAQYARIGLERTGDEPIGEPVVGEETTQR